ncbi:MAG: DUF2332 domain-containing protein [Pseudomonadota bacterium]
MIRKHFRNQAEHCGRLGSPFTAMLVETAAERLSERSEVGRATLGWPGDPKADALALRFAGSLHALVLSGEAPDLAEVYPGTGATKDPDLLWSRVEQVFDHHRSRLLGMLESPPQTNEVARSAVLVGGLLTIASQTGRPLALHEIGASAGLNLHWDAYRYRLGDSSWGPEDAPLRLTPEWRGPPPSLATVVVGARRGCDQSPIDPGAAADRLRLRAYIWADQRARLERLEAALDHAARCDARVERADAADWVEAQLADPPRGMTTVLYHSIMWQYLPRESQQRITSALRNAGSAASEDRPLAWLRMEPSPEGGHADLTLTTWPGETTELLAHADYHGRWINWLAG